MPASHETVSNGGHFVKMDGRRVFRFATRIMARATEEVLEKVGWQVDDLALIIPHQANIRIIQSAARQLNLPEEKFFTNLDRYGNTSAASVPIALCEAVASGCVSEGDRLVLVGFGAGLTWAAVALEWGVPMPIRPQPWFRRLAFSLRFVWARVRSALLRARHWVHEVTLAWMGENGWRARVRQWLARWRRRRHWTRRRK